MVIEVAYYETLSKDILAASLVLTTIVSSRTINCLFFHPLRIFPSPWYAACPSLPLALSSFLNKEPDWLMFLVNQYGDGVPIRITPNIVFFYRAASLRGIYWDPQCNTKSRMYGHETLGAPSMFQALDGQDHRALRKVLGGSAWSIGSLKNAWESRFDSQIRIFVSKETVRAKNKEPIVLSDKVSEFAADIMTMVSFTKPWGFVQNDRDERSCNAWRESLLLFGTAQRWRFFHELWWQSASEIARRECCISDENFSLEQPDSLQLTLEAKLDGEPLTPTQKIAPMALRIQAGADTTGTALGCTLLLLTTHPRKLAKVRHEIEAADVEGYLREVVQYDETREHLSYICACIRGTDMTTEARVVQQDPDTLDKHPDDFSPERWLHGEGKAAKMEAGMFVFGMAPRACLGKEIALLETHKPIPEIICRFDIELLSPGRYYVRGGVAVNEGFTVQLSPRKETI
ncbi:cytochrome P450 17A1 [Bisporella sp. PMI_857]|nr:cytochrome P450 17A1 [Bisporella sp. PMI_857]